MSYQISLFIFRRDLRLNDNTGLISALANSKNVIPCFIFDPRQIQERNTYRSLHALQFMLESLEDLQQQLKSNNGRLFFFYGQPEEIITLLSQEFSLDAVHVNHDYTPFSTLRDATMEDTCKKLGIKFFSHRDLLLHEPEEILNGSKKPYHVFTPYYNNWRAQPFRTIHHTTKNNYHQTPSMHEYTKDYWRLLPNKNQQNVPTGGRAAATKLLKKLNHLKNYPVTRDTPAIATTELAAHIKFGTYSIREIYNHIQQQVPHPEELIRQLCWRDFYTMIAWHYPHVFGHSFHQEHDAMTWSTNKEHFQRWCNGMTGFPLVDAGMRQMNTTGSMHNRVRMIVASFLVKDLHIHWLWGENYFARTLIDYDPAVNNGNWQWIASTGCAAQPYFRIMNPWRQQKEHDPEAIYIKEWVPELRSLSAAMIHDAEPAARGNQYPQPMVNHAEEVKYTLAQNKSRR